MQKSTASLSETLGKELRDAREAVGLQRPQVATQLSIHVQTLAGYERGTVEIPAFRLVGLCEVLGVSAPDVMARAMQRAKIGLDTTGIQIDLYAVIADTTRRSLAPLRRWARKKLADDETGIARLKWSTTIDLTSWLGISEEELVELLVSYTPGYRR